MLVCNGEDTKLSGSEDIPEPNAELAQYFTPKSVVIALWRLVQKRLISQENQEIRAIDLAAGAGVWLDVLIDSGGVRPDDAYGIEIDQRWADRSGVSYTGDGLLGVFDGIKDDTFDVVVGNPPFGKMSNFCAAMGGPDSRMLAERFPLWQRLGENRDSYPIELLFVERALQVLRPGGWGVLVLPEGILANAKLQSARDQLLRDLTLKVIIELPLSVFRSKGLNAKTSAVIFKRGCEGRRHSVGLYKARFEVQQPTVSAFLAQVERGKGTLLSACYVGQSSFFNKRWDVGYWRGTSLVRQLNRRFPTQSLGFFIEHLTYGPIVKFKIFRILTITLSFFFLTGFVPILSFVGPGVTALTSGNIYKASAQFIVNQRIEKETGKNSLALIKETLIEETDIKIKKNSFDEDLRQLVETRIKMTRQKLDNQNLQKLLKKRIEVTRSILNINNITQ